MGAMGSAALMGASGFMTVIYAITKINYTYEIPLFLMATLRGAVGDHHKHHISNGLYLLPVLDAISMPYQIIDKPEDIGLISRCYHHTRTFSRPMVVLFTRDLLRGGPLMKYVDCFRAIARHRTDEIVVTSAGNSGQAWWAATRDSEASFYLDASMSLSTHVCLRPRAGAAGAEGLGVHGRRRILHESRHADGRAADEPAEPDAFPGLQPRLWRDIQCRLAEFQGQRLRRHRALAWGLSACFEFQRSDQLEREFPALKAANARAIHSSCSKSSRSRTQEQKLEQPPFDGPELKFRFGRHLESQDRRQRIWLQDLRRGLRNMYRARSC